MAAYGVDGQHRHRFIDLFAGCGGLALGFTEEGFEPADAVEWDEDGAETYRRNIDDRIHVQDIAAVTEWPQVEVVIGGPPCQGFSQLGPRDPDDPRNRLWNEYLRVLKVSCADVFVLENVPQLLKSPQFHEFDRAVRGLGFEVDAAVLCAADYGVPQVRNRAIVIGSRLGTPPKPMITHGPKSPSRAPYVTVQKALTEPYPLSEEPDGRNWHSQRPGIKDYSTVRYAAVPKNGGNRFEMQENLDRQGLGHLVPGCWRRKVTGTTDVFGRLWWDRPASTIRTEFFKPEKGRYLHPSADRPITVREAARLQSFPDTFEFPGHQSRVSVARQIGNAVPPRLAAAIARSVLDHLDGSAVLRSDWATAEEPRQLELVS